eukprot:CAMPEP_0179335598 /NCGR_PEP_ID=MMETSP0797-20121207/66583_1 /TAXON_ID=47934 /ORGANISM="Dinophysis acuminata, Strain DAEP01" /LENGTH=365 /DNA_ID=CAMNT_0021049005 /DNA_START=57 /DNA_END=1155 /DNA_ORIENTATION=+
MAVVLTPIDTPQRAFYWRAPAGTKDLSLDVDLRPVGGPGGAALSVQCEHNDLEPLVDAAIGALNRRVRSTEMYGAQWSWSGEPEVPSNHSFREWFRINGTLGCDIELVLSNIHAAALFGSFEYSWEGIDPCPETLKGCAPCPDDVCSEDERVFCDGSRYWECIPADDMARVTITAAVTTSSSPASGSTEAVPRLPRSPSANVEWARGIMVAVWHFLGPALLVLLALAVGVAIIFGLRHLVRLCWQRIHHRKQMKAKVQEDEEYQLDDDSQSYSSSRSDSEPEEVAPLLSVLLICHGWGPAAVPEIAGLAAGHRGERHVDHAARQAAAGREGAFTVGVGRRAGDGRGELPAARGRGPAEHIPNHLA